MEILKIIALIESQDLRNTIKSKLKFDTSEAANELMKEFVSRIEISTKEPSQEEIQG